MTCSKSNYEDLLDEFPEGASGHAYAQLATAFWEEFSQSRAMSTACGRAIDYAATHADEILAPLGSAFYGWGQRDYAPEDICPLSFLEGGVVIPPTISAFGVEIEETASGKRLTFEWETFAASRVEIWSGHTQRRSQVWEVPPQGTFSVDVAETHVRDPVMQLVAYGSRGARVSQALKTDWPCTYEYFFEPAPQVCPLYEAIQTAAAEQAFEGGRMIWLEQIEDGDKVILVLYGDGKLARFDDTWTPGDPEHDATIVPPQGRYQPVRGFGKIWRENPMVRERLVWALGPEQGFEGAWQEQVRESIPRIAFLRTFEGQIVTMWGWGAGTPSWQAGWVEY